VKTPAALRPLSRSWQFVHRLSHLPDQLAEPSALCLRFRGMEPATPTTVALASRCASRWKVLGTLDDGAPVIYDVDAGETLWSITEALREIEGWWAARSTLESDRR